MTPRLRMSGIRKSYGPTAALSGVDLELAPGEVHAVVGENGAGKSTLVKVLSGAEKPDGGTLELDGQPYAPRGPVEARRRGVVMVYQELAVCPDLSVEANVMLGQERTSHGVLNGPTNRFNAAGALRDLGHPEIDLHAPVSSLSPSARQVVEIARALISAATVLVLDEPTSALPREDVRRLFDLIRRLKAAGMTIVYISHFLEEIEEVADRFTVLRDGVAVGAGKVGDVPREKIIEMMVGRAVEEQYPHTPHAIGEPVLELTDLCGDPVPTGVNLMLRRGEILGIAGIVGSGRTELLRAVYGLDPVRSGRVRIGTRLDSGATPSDRIVQGLGLLSEDRKQEGLALEMSIADNVTLSRLGRGFLSRSRLAEAVSAVLTRLGVRYRDGKQPVGELSGGNQQKVALGRLFYQGADILLLDEPTKGVDVGSKAEIYRQIGAAAASGKAVIVVSSYLPELFGVCDTLAVMCRGRLTAPRAVSEWTPESVISAATTAS
jgi:ribose transport system ATP-binding protein